MMEVGSMDKILMVDDDVNLLNSMKRVLHGKLEADFAKGGAEALLLLDANEYSVIVSDMQMPGMNGVEFLKKASLRRPDSVRVMLTGNADLKTAIDAINEGQIFRFLLKPFAPEGFLSILQVCQRQYRLVTAEKILLEKTLSGTVKMLANILAVSHPSIFNRTMRILQLFRKIAPQLNLADTWKIEIGIMLSQLGCMMIPIDVVEKSLSGTVLSPQELRLIQEHPRIGSDLVRNIPRLEDVAEIIAYQNKNFDGNGFPKDEKVGESIPLGARILRLLLDYERLMSKGISPLSMLNTLRNQTGAYDSSLLKVLEASLLSLPETRATSYVAITDLEENMVLAEDIISTENQVLMEKGLTITQYVKLRLVNYRNNGLIKDQANVYID